MDNFSFSLFWLIIIILVVIIGIFISYLLYKNNTKKLQDEIKNQKILPESRQHVDVDELESTESGKKLLDIYRAPFKYLQDFSEPNPVDSKRENVVVWGSVGSGKSWLIAALGASFYKYNSSDRLYILQDIGGDGDNVVDPFATPRRPSATPYPSYEHFQFARRFRNTSVSHRISSQAHSIMVWDTQGGATESPDYSENEILKNADYIIFTLDHTRLNLKYGGNEKEILSRVFNTWKANAPQNRPHIAICLTKIDLLSSDLINREPLEILHTVFGDEIYNIIVSHPNTKVFATSAMGFITSDDGVKPNCDYRNGELLDSEKWEPFGVEFPFFWLFEIRTQDSIGKNIFKKLFYKMFYIQYPKPPTKTAA